MRDREQNEHVEYIPRPEAGPTDFIKVELYYSKGGMNYLDFKTIKRGYYGAVKPVKREVHPGYSTERFQMFGGGGGKWLILEVTRKSAKAEAQALALFNEQKAAYIERLKVELGKPRIKTLTIAGKLIAIPPCFQELTECELLAMPVETIIEENGLMRQRIFLNLSEAAQFLPCDSAMRGQVSGVAALRFESQSVSQILSR